MNDSTTKKETILIIAAGLIIGAIAVGLVFFGNPANMGFCIACFIRDTTGALGFHSAAAVQYIRPEIVGLVLGAFILALVTKEFKPRGGSAPVTRFVIAMFVMIGCLMFLGCPFLKKGYTLKRSYSMQKTEGTIFTVLQLVILALLVATPAFIHFTETDGGPGAKHAAIGISLVAGLVVGALAQRTRLCMVGGIRDVVLFGEWKLLSGFLAILVAAFIGNAILGFWNPGFAGQPIAHNFGLASSAEGPTANGKAAVLVGIVVLLVIAACNSIRKKGAA